MFHVWEIYLDNCSWFHDARNEFQTGCTGIPDAPRGFFDIFIEPAFTAVWIFRKRDWQTQKQEPKEHFKCLLDRNNPACKHVFKSLSSMFKILQCAVNTMLSRSPPVSRSESKQDSAELTTSDPSHQNVTNLPHKNSNYLTSAVFLLQTLSPCNNLTSMSADAPEH